MPFVAPGEDFGRGYRLLPGSFPAEGCGKHGMVASREDSRNVGDRRGAAANDEIFAGLDSGEERGEVRLGFSDLHVACHISGVPAPPGLESAGAEPAFVRVGGAWRPDVTVGQVLGQVSARPTSSRLRSI